MDKLDDARKKKIEEMVQEAIAKGGGANGGGGAAKAAGGSGAAAAGRPPSRSTSGVPAAAGASGSGSRPGTARNSPKALAPKNLNRVGSSAGGAAKGGAAPAAARRLVSQPASGGAASSGARGRASGSGGAAAKEEDLSVGKLSNEELEGRMNEMFGSSTGRRVGLGRRGMCSIECLLHESCSAAGGGACRPLWFWRARCVMPYAAHSTCLCEILGTLPRCPVVFWSCSGAAAQR